MSRLFCFGFGYLAQRVAALVTAEGGTATGTSREGAGGTILFDGKTPMADPVETLGLATHLLISIPPAENHDRVLAHHVGDIMAMPSLEWIGYLSTTGPYGDRAGGLVDEHSIPVPTSERGMRRLHAETDWRHLGDSYGIPVHIFRLAGIYGPGRSAIDKLRAGTARHIVKQGQVFSRIHVDDAAAVVRASMDAAAHSRIFNVADDEAAPPQDVVTFAAELLGVEPPPETPFLDADLSPMARSFYNECKRVSNQRMKDELGVTLQYPTYREGLKAVLQTESD